ncbi:MAG: galactose-1-phosphate uridylyltransferase [Bacilli bacterium]|jgi:UDPglucose--hexose-1-phosphate uridylyltransferase
MLDVIVEKLLIYAKNRLGLSDDDLFYLRNILLFNFHLKAPYKGPINVSEIKAMKTPDVLLDELRLALKESKIIEEWRIEGLVTEVMGFLTPAPSLVTEQFKKLYKKDKKSATDYLYDLSVANNYIQSQKIAENISWTSEMDDGHKLEITINLSKPEKDNKDIIKEAEKEDEDEYPSCPLCRENVGYGGSYKIPPRQNLRIIPLRLENENWFLQYSPYVYYDKHCIVIFEEHKPMAITPRVFGKLFAFVDQFPHFFIGSNSDLPIVGGSILSHEHFQGGQSDFPLFNAPKRTLVKSRHDKRVTISIADWYNTVIVLKSKTRDKDKLIDVASKICETWINYSNPELDIIAFTGDTRHNTVTPIVTKDKNGYTMYLILRNNRTSEEHPDGIFHAHKEYHGIKKEGIGLIEAMGMFILPARLKRQFAIVEDVYDGKLTKEEALSKHPDLSVHEPLFVYLDERKDDELATEEKIKQYVAETCRNILINTAVFKNDPKSQDELLKMLKSIKY